MSQPSLPFPCRFCDHSFADGKQRKDHCIQTHRSEFNITGQCLSCGELVCNKLEFYDHFQSHSEQFRQIVEHAAELLSKPPAEFEHQFWLVAPAFKPIDQKELMKSFLSDNEKTIRLKMLEQGIRRVMPMEDQEIQVKTTAEEMENGDVETSSDSSTVSVASSTSMPSNPQASVTEMGSATGLATATTTVSKLSVETATAEGGERIENVVRPKKRVLGDYGFELMSAAKKPRQDNSRDAREKLIALVGSTFQSHWWPVPTGGSKRGRRSVIRTGALDSVLAIMISYQKRNPDFLGFIGGSKIETILTRLLTSNNIEQEKAELVREIISNILLRFDTEDAVCHSLFGSVAMQMVDLYKCASRIQSSYDCEECNVGAFKTTKYVFSPQGQDDNEDVPFPDLINESILGGVGCNSIREDKTRCTSQRAIQHFTAHDDTWIIDIDLSLRAPRRKAARVGEIPDAIEAANDTFELAGVVIFEPAARHYMSLIRTADGWVHYDGKEKDEQQLKNVRDLPTAFLEQRADITNIMYIRSTAIVVMEPPLAADVSHAIIDSEHEPITEGVESETEEDRTIEDLSETDRETDLDDSTDSDGSSNSTTEPTGRTARSPPPAPRSARSPSEVPAEDAPGRATPVRSRSPSYLMDEPDTAEEIENSNQNIKQEMEFDEEEDFHNFPKFTPDYSASPPDEIDPSNVPVNYSTFAEKVKKAADFLPRLESMGLEAVNSRTAQEAGFIPATHTKAWNSAIYVASWSETHPELMDALNAHFLCHDKFYLQPQSLRHLRCAFELGGEARAACLELIEKLGKDIKCCNPQFTIARLRLDKTITNRLTSFIHKPKKDEPKVKSEVDTDEEEDQRTSTRRSNANQNPVAASSNGSANLSFGDKVKIAVEFIPKLECKKHNYRTAKNAGFIPAIEVDAHSTAWNSAIFLASWKSSHRELFHAFECHLLCCDKFYLPRQSLSQIHRAFDSGEAAREACLKLIEEMGEKIAGSAGRKQLGLAKTITDRLDVFIPKRQRQTKKRGARKSGAAEEEDDDEEAEDN